MMSPHLFDEDIVQTLRYGDSGNTEGLSYFTGPGGDFENTVENNVRAFIVTLYLEKSEDESAYQDVIDRIEGLLHNILGRQDTMIIPYHRNVPELYLRDKIMTHGHGKILIQYDPVQDWISGAPGACDVQQAAIELWFEDRPWPRYSDQWEAFPSQFPRWPWHGQLDAVSAENAELLEALHMYNGTDEEKLEKYKAHMKMRIGDSCPLISKSAVTSSTKSASSLLISSSPSLS